VAGNNLQAQFLARVKFESISGRAKDAKKTEGKGFYLRALRAKNILPQFHARPGTARDSKIHRIL
jgi:hypothetical protein